MPNITSRSLAVLLGISAFSITGYLLLLLFRKDDDDDYPDSVSKTSNCRAVEIRIPKEMVRVIIGRNGNNIRLIQEQSNTRIRFRETEGDERICVVRGTRECCAIAESLISEFISSQPQMESVEMWVPQTSVGKIIGRCGEKIQEIQSVSGTKINVSDEGRDDLTRCIIIKGTKEQILVAKAFIDDIVDEFQNNRLNLGLALSRREPRLPPKSSTSPKPPRCSTPRSERISPLLNQPDVPFEVYVSAVVDPSHFWIQIVGPKATELDRLVEEMTEYYGDERNRRNHKLCRCEKGDLVAAVFRYDGKWYRAEVLRVFAGETDGEEERAELYYVDYGDVDVVGCGELWELRTDFLWLHFQAIECFLANVEPNGTEWSEEAIDKFEEWTHVAQWKKLSAKMNGYQIREKLRAKREGSPVPGVELYDIREERDVSIAKELVEHGYAVHRIGKAGNDSSV